MLAQTYVLQINTQLKIKGLLGYVCHTRRGSKKHSLNKANQKTTAEELSKTCYARLSLTHLHLYVFDSRRRQSYGQRPENLTTCLSKWITCYPTRRLNSRILVRTDWLAISGTTAGFDFKRRAGFHANSFRTQLKSLKIN